jgi:hypothetical protein
MIIIPDSSSVFASSHSGWGGWTLSKDLTIKVFLSLRNHTSVLIHWRYQVALLKHLNGPDIDTYLNFGLDFMTDPDNLMLLRL